MSEENKEKQKTEQSRDEKGHFTPKTQTVDIGQSQPKMSDYTKMNSFMAKQLGLTDKLADLQTKYDPQDLFNRLSFMNENTSTWKQENKKGELPPNEDFVRITPGPDKFNLPGMPIGTQRMGKEDKFGLHIAFDPVKLFTPKKK